MDTKQLIDCGCVQNAELLISFLKKNVVLEKWIIIRINDKNVYKLKVIKKEDKEWI